MKILVLNGSPRPQGDTAKMVAVFRETAESAGHFRLALQVLGDVENLRDLAYLFVDLGFLDLAQLQRISKLDGDVTERSGCFGTELEQKFARHIHNEGIVGFKREGLLLGREVDALTYTRIPAALRVQEEAAAHFEIVTVLFSTNRRTGLPETP